VSSSSTNDDAKGDAFGGGVPLALIGHPRRVSPKWREVLARLAAIEFQCRTSCKNKPSHDSG